MARKRLTLKQRQFVREYLIDLNGTQAAIRAGYSPQTANEQAAQLLAKLSIRRAVREAMKVRAARTEVTADKVIRELAVVAFSNPANYQFTDAGHLRVRPGADRGAMRAVASFKRKARKALGDIEYIDAEFKLWDKVSALKTLCQHLGLLKAPEVPPLEVILAALPADVAGQLRPLLGRALHAGRDPSGN